MNVCVYECMYKCMNVCMDIFEFMFEYKSACMTKWMYVCKDSDQKVTERDSIYVKWHNNEWMMNDSWQDSLTLTLHALDYKQW